MNFRVSKVLGLVFAMTFESCFWMFLRPSLRDDSQNSFQNGNICSFLAEWPTNHLLGSNHSVVVASHAGSTFDLFWAMDSIATFDFKEAKKVVKNSFAESL